MSEATAAAITGASLVVLHELSVRQEGDKWVIGRVETGDFITAPEIAGRAVSLLNERLPVEVVAHRLEREAGEPVDVAGFVAALVDLGFVASLDGRTLASAEVERPSLPWLKPAHVRWMSHPLTLLTLIALTLAAVAALVADPSLVPTYRDLIWSPHGSALIVGNAAISWSIIFLHELAHLGTARAVGVPARMSLGTRLQFLAAQTDVSGIWAHPRGTRVTVYLSGMGVNVAVAALAILAQYALPLEGLPARLAAGTALLSLTLLVPQFLIFMRTDIYFLIQDLSGCGNLYADGAAYLKYLANRITRPRRIVHDPCAALPPRERRTVRVYCVILTLGTALCLSVAALVSIPVAVTIVVNAVSGLALAPSALVVADSLIAISVIVLMEALWARAWWRRHGPRVSRGLRRAIPTRFRRRA